MNDLQKNYIENARKLGISYQEIAEKTGLSREVVKKYCKRSGLEKDEVVSHSDSKNVCKYCGKPFISLPGRKPKIFCSRKCGLLWWSAHPEQRNSRIQIKVVCPQCGKTFINTRNRERRFCSVACSSLYRKKETNHDAQ